MYFAKRRKGNVFHGYVVDMTSTGVSPRDRAMPPLEFNWEEAHQSKRTAYAIEIMSAFGKATTVFKQKGNGGVYEYATYLHSRIYDVESSGAKLRYRHLMTTINAPLVVALD